MTENIYLFSYGTLQQEEVQMETFGRLLQGTEDVLQGYRLGEIEITDTEVLRSSKKKLHPILFFTGSSKDSVIGTVFRITSSELEQADAYEVLDYQRVCICLKSGIYCWAYVSRKTS